MKLLSTGYFGGCWLLISDSVSFLLPHLNLQGIFLSVKAAKEKQKKEGRRWREKIPFQFQLQLIWIFVQLLCSKECLPGLFENCHFSQIKC